MQTTTKIPPCSEGRSNANDQVAQARQNEAARKLLREWLADTTGYDEEAWPQAKKVIEENRLSPRSRFDD